MLHQTLSFTHRRGLKTPASASTCPSAQSWVLHLVQVSM
jgi:hypothetical protein